MVYSRIFTKINNFIFKKSLSQKVSIISNLVIFCSNVMSVFFSKNNPRLNYIKNYYYYIFNKRKFFENKLAIIYKKLFFYNFNFYQRLNTQNRKLNIVIVGNLNNLLLPFALTLRKFGHNVQLILTSTESLHRPESIYKEWNNNLPKWIIDYGQKDI